jgi:hypothetical protein
MHLDNYFTTIPSPIAHQKSRPQQKIWFEPGALMRYIPTADFRKCSVLVSKYRRFLSTRTAGTNMYTLIDMYFDDAIHWCHIRAFGEYNTHAQHCGHSYRPRGQGPRWSLLENAERLVVFVSVKVEWLESCGRLRMLQSTRKFTPSNTY